MESANNDVGDKGSPLDTSMSSTSSIDKKALRKLKTQTFLRQIFLAWKAFTKQVVTDKRLFFKIRDFIIRRLSSKAFKSLKVHYIIETLIKHIKNKRSKRALHQYFHGWQVAIQIQKRQNVALLSLTQMLEKRLAFIGMKENSHQLKLEKQLNSNALRFWSRSLLRKCFLSFSQNVFDKQSKRANLLKLYLFTDRRLKSLLIQNLKLNIAYRKYYRRLNIRALLFFKRVYLRLGLRCFIVNRRESQTKRLNKMQALRFKSERERAIAINILKQWGHAKCEKVERDQKMADLVERITGVKSGFLGILQYQLRVQEIERESIQKRWFSGWVRAVRFIKKLREQIKIMKEKGQQRILSLAFEGLKQNQSANKSNTIKLFAAIQKSQLSSYFGKIKLFTQKKTHLEILSKTLIKAQLKHAFTRLFIFSKLRILNDPKLILHLILSHYFTVWKELSQEDRRLQKLTYRAYKHRSRFVKLQVLHSLLTLVRPPVSMTNSRRHDLLKIGLNSLKLYRRSRIIRCHKFKKAVNHRLSTLFTSFYKITIQQRQSRAILLQAKAILNKQSQARITGKVLQAWMKHTYIKRVEHYLRSNNEGRVKAKYFQQIREVYVSQKIQGIKDLKAENHIVRNILFKSFAALYDYKQRRFVNRCRQQQAFKHRVQSLLRKSLYALYFAKQNRYLKNQMLKEAQFEHIKSKLQYALSKIVSVGIYWAQIKGRFGQKPGNNRIYLAMKYGMRWRAKALISRFSTLHPTIIKPKQIQEVSPLITQNIKRSLFPELPKFKPSIQQLSKHSINFSQSKPPQPLTLKKEPSRLAFIEQELLAFKQKKLLLRELEDQFSSIQQSPQNIGMIALMKSKIQTLKSELLSVQPKLKELVAEISILKGANTQNVGLNNSQFSFSPYRQSNTSNLFSPVRSSGGVMKQY